MLRLILSVLAGYVTMFAAVFVTFTASYRGLGADRAFRPGTYEVTPVWMVLSVVLGFSAALLGGLYVLEGSRLGGALLIRSVPSDLPRAFLTPGNPAAWRAFVELMGERLRLSADVEAAIEGAISVFAAFETSARNISGADRT